MRFSTMSKMLCLVAFSDANNYATMNTGWCICLSFHIHPEGRIHTYIPALPVATRRPYKAQRALLFLALHVFCHPVWPCLNARMRSATVYRQKRVYERIAYVSVDFFPRTILNNNYALLVSTGTWSRGGRDPSLSRSLARFTTYKRPVLRWNRIKIHGNVVHGCLLPLYAKCGMKELCARACALPGTRCTNSPDPPSFVVRIPWYLKMQSLNVHLTRSAHRWLRCTNSIVSAVVKRIAHR